MGTIYTDALVDLTDDELVVKHYFYPRGTAKRIPLHTIQTLIAYPPLIRYGKGRVWGTGSFWIWFARDWDRPRRAAIYHITLTHQRIKVGFTVKDAARFSACLAAKGLLTRTG
jgi:hypothetical protein